jgi:aminoglycoside 6-adenylyltransferase
MKNLEKQQLVVNRLVQWAERQDFLRAMLLFSSRANPAAPVDVFSDYDILMAVTDVHPLHSDDRWLNDFGKVLVVYRNPIGVEQGFERFGFITHYEEGVKIDYCVYPAEYLSWAAREPKLPDDLDNGYIVLLDKDHLTDELKPPTYRAYVPCPPTAQEYLAVIEEFFNDAIYVAKHLWRDNLLLVKHILDYDLKFVGLRKMLVWRMEHAHHWQIKPGAHGKGLKKYVEPEIWAELESTYVGAGIDENWEALFGTIRLFRKTATEVARQLGYLYPDPLDERVFAYILKIRNTDKQADSFSGIE